MDGGSADAALDVPPVKGLADGGWGDGEVPWLPYYPVQQVSTLSVWSRPGAVYFSASYLVRNNALSGNPVGIFVNHGMGWSEFHNLGALGFDGGESPPIEMRGVPWTDTLWLAGRRNDSAVDPNEELGLFHADATAVTFASDGAVAVEAIYVVDSETAYATDGDLVVRFTGERWEPLPVRVPYPVKRLWASRTALWGVGNSGNIVSYETDHWQSHASGTLLGLAGIWGFADDDIWVTDIIGNLLHYDGMDWSAVPWPESPGSDQAGTTAFFNGLWGAEGVLYLYGPGLLARYNTKADTPAFELLADWHCSEPGLHCPVSLWIEDLWGNSPDEVFLAVAQYDVEQGGGGWYSVGGNAFLLYFDGEQFRWF
jgi:hypothetical protein